MGKQALQQALATLREELGELTGDDSGSIEKLTILINDIESRIEQPEDADQYQSLVDATRDAITYFEETHPRATAILNDIMMALGNMGI